jgi:hypothetical protein
VKKLAILIPLLFLFIFASCDGGAFGNDSSSSDTLVYVTKSGEKYHQKSCRTIKKSNIFAMTKGEALAAGYGRCAVCKP